MKNWKLCDCTLQSGGKICDWYFGKDVICEVIKEMLVSRVDYVEVGILSREGFSVDRAVYDSVERVTDIISDEGDEKNYSITICLNDELPYKELMESKRNDIILRVQFLKEDMALAEEYCAMANKKGYRISVHPLYIEQYSEQEIIDLTNRLNCFEPEIFYLDDSIGMISNYEKLHKWVSLLENQVSKKTQIGFCGYFANKNLLNWLNKICELKLTHLLVIDASINGIGIGAGMLPIELLMDDNTVYNKSKVEELYTKYIGYLKKNYHWGENVNYTIAMQYGVDPAYVDYFDTMHIVTSSSMHEALKMLPMDVKCNFNKTVAQKCFYQYMKNKAGLVVVVPTANRALTIHTWLSVAARDFYKLGVDVVIYDSSDDDETEAVVTNFICDGCTNVRYQRYTGKVIGYSIDQKVIDAYDEYSTLYKYVWVCRDGLLLYPLNALKIMQDAMNEEVPFIICNAEFRDYRHIGNCKYTDVAKLFKEQCAQMTLLGATIIRGDVAKSIVRDIPLEKGRNYALWQPFAILEYIADKELTVQSCVGDIFGYNPSAPAKQFWKSNSMHIWGERWYENIQSLPSVYDVYKAEVLKVEMIDFHPFSLMELLKIRASNGLNFKIIRENKKRIPLVCDTELVNFYIIALIPKWFARLMLKKVNSNLREIVRVIYYVLRGELPNSERVNGK